MSELKSEQSSCCPRLSFHMILKQLYEYWQRFFLLSSAVSHWSNPEQEATCHSSLVCRALCCLSPICSSPLSASMKLLRCVSLLFQILPLRPSKTIFYSSPFVFVSTLEVRAILVPGSLLLIYLWFPNNASVSVSTLASVDHHACHQLPPASWLP